MDQIRPKSKSLFAHRLDRRTIRDLAGDRFFGRGEDYFNGGQVDSLKEEGGVVQATVLGSLSYRVKLWPDGHTVRHDCTCPLGREGRFCKHCVAVALAWIDQGESVPTIDKRASNAQVTTEDLRRYLASRDKDALIDLLMEQVMGNDRLRRRLLTRAAKQAAKRLDVTAYRRAIDRSVGSGPSVDYRQVSDYASRIEETIDSIEDLLGEGFATEVVDLAEHALKAVEGEIDPIDDSDGSMLWILDRLQDLHLHACAKSRPDPERLARRLFHRELESEWDLFRGSAETYAEILGQKGLAAYRRLAEAEWTQVAPLGPGETEREQYGRRLRITHIMESLALQAGDLEAWVAVRTRDLSSAWSYLQIALAYKEAGKELLALEWAERGVKAFPKRTDPRLRRFLADTYHSLDRHEDAMALVWAEFGDSPDLERYRNLKIHADRSGQWQAWRSKALERLRRRIAREKGEARGDRWTSFQDSDHSELVRVFLWEEDQEAAWREAMAGGCTNDLWLELAVRRGSEHPIDALAIYQNLIEPTLEEKDIQAYRDATSLLKKIQNLLNRLDRRSEFGPYLESIRAAHRRKRNFMALLNAEEWDL